MTRFRCLCVALSFLAVALTASAKEAPKSVAELAAHLPDSSLHSSLTDHVVYVDFWASWCMPCRQSFPWMKNMAEKYARNGLTIIAINVDKEHKAAEKFLGDTKAPFTVVYDSNGTLAELYDLKAMPSSFLYGRDGALREHHEGFHANDTLAIDSLVWELVHEKKREKKEGGE